MNKLYVYYDYFNEASDIYLKMLEKDAKEKGFELTVFNNLTDLNNKMIYGAKVLPLLPVLNDGVFDLLRKYPNSDIDNTTGVSPYVSATAYGIFLQIIKNFKKRDTVISVIGRGVVGKALIDMLITYGYTVIEINSQTNKQIRSTLLNSSDVIVGLSSRDDIITEGDVELGCKWFIDCRHNFNFENRSIVSKCGKWTREVLYGRILGEDYEE